MTTGSISIDKALFDELRVPERDIHVLVLRVDRDQLEHAEAAVDQVLLRYHEEDEERYETVGLSRGAWTWTRANDAIVMDVLDCDDPVLATVEELAADLAALGVSGRLEPRPTTQVERLPALAYVIEARLHVGEAAPDGESLGWHTETEAWERVLTVAVDWCTDRGRLRDVVFRKSFLDPFLLDLKEDPIGRLMKEREDNPELWTNDGGETRWVTTDRMQSRISLITLFPLEESSPPWRLAYAGMKEAVTVAADQIAYAFVKHGASTQYAELGMSLLDWPARPGWDHRMTSGITAVLQDDHRAPDAFALQALGPGYDLPEPSFPSFTTERVSHTQLLEHNDLDAWFEGLFIPPGTPYVDLPRIPIPTVLADARAELDPILLQMQDLAGRKFHLDPGGLP
jgi:hypothetical protein